MSWQKQESNNDFWNPDKEGEVLEGQVCEIRTGQYGKQYMIRKDDGNEVLTPSHKVLQGKMTKVLEGMKVRLVFLKQDLPKVKGQQGVKLYDVYIDTVEEEKVQ